MARNYDDDGNLAGPYARDQHPDGGYSDDYAREQHDAVEAEEHHTEETPGLGKASE